MEHFKRVTFIVRPINSARRRFASIKPFCSPTSVEGWKLAQHRNAAAGGVASFYIKSGRSEADTPCPNRVLRLPRLLSPEEVARLIGRGRVSLSEHLAHDPLCHRRPPGQSRAPQEHQNIHRQRMVVHIRSAAKGARPGCRAPFEAARGTARLIGGAATQAYGPGSFPRNDGTWPSTRSGPRFARTACHRAATRARLARSFERSQCCAELETSFPTKLTSTRPSPGRLASVLSVGATDASPRANT